MLGSHTRRVFPLICSLLLAVGTLRAQTFRGGINGAVTDSSGAVITGAHVQAVENATNVVHQTLSSSAGEFSLSDLPLGAYTVTVAAKGFQVVQTSNVTVAAGSIYSLTVKMPVASASTTVQVSAAALTLDTTTETQTTDISNEPSRIFR